MRDSIVCRSLAVVAGAGSLVFEVAAMRLLGGHVGNTTTTAAGGIAAFLAAQAIGAWIGGVVGDRAARPKSAFCGFAVLAAIAIAVMPGWTAAWATGSGVESTTLDLLLQTLVIVFLPALPAGTLTPLLVGLMERERGSAALGRASGFLYSLSTLGAVIGCLMAGAVAVPNLGITATCTLAAGMIAISGIAGFVLLRDPTPSESADDSAQHQTISPPQSLTACLVAAGTGLAALILEIAGSRWLAQYHTSSAVVLAAVLALFLAGIAIGSSTATALRLGPAHVPRLLAAFALAIAATGPAIHLLAKWRDVIMLRDVGGIVALAAFIPLASALSGAIYAALLRTDGSAAGSVARAVGGTRFGALQFANALGSILGAWVAAYVALPMLGVHRTLVATAGIVAIFALVLAAKRKQRLDIAVSALVLVLSASTLPLDLRALPVLAEGEQVLMHREGSTANVTVVRSTKDSSVSLFVNRVARQGSVGPFARVERRQGLLPGLLHSGPRSALALGVGTGGTVSGLIDAGAIVIDAVEIVPEVIPALDYFIGPYGNLLKQANVTFHRDDAVNFLARSKKQYDLIIGDLYFPWAEGASALYSREHFERARERLAPGGLFCQWLPMHQMRFEDFSRVATTFRRVFDQTFLVLCDPESPLPVVGLIGSIDVLKVDPDAIDSRIQRLPACPLLGITNAQDLIELYLGDQYTLRAQLEPEGREAARIITLDRPDLEYEVASATESEWVLALNNLDNIGRYFGDVPTPYLTYPESWNEESRKRFLREISNRTAAFKQYLFGRYWEIRGSVAGDDPLGDEQRAVDRFTAILGIDPKHRATLAAVERTLFVRFASKRYQQVIDLGALALRQNPEAVRLRRHVGLAYLMLGQPELAFPVFEGDRERVDPLTDTGLAIAGFLLGKTAEAKAAAEHALTDPSGADNRLATAILRTIEGDRVTARRILDPFQDHPQWGLLARKIAERIEQSP